MKLFSLQPVLAAIFGLLAPVMVAATSNSDLAGKWELVSAGYDKNSNRVLEDSEKEGLERVTGGFDLLHLKPDGSCVYDREIEFDGTWAAKPRNNKPAIYVYPIGLPKSLPEEERDSAAFCYYLVSADRKTLVLRPAHLGNQLLVYARR